MAETKKDKSNENLNPFAGLGDMGGFGKFFQLIGQIFSSFFGGNFLAGLFGGGKNSPAQQDPTRPGAAQTTSASTPSLIDRGRNFITRKWDSLLDMIGHHESKGDYNVAFGGKRADFTNMTINEVLDWQKAYVKNGSPSSAAGKYQVIQDTLRGGAKEMGLTGNEKFDEKMQDRLAMHLLQKRGLGQFERGQISESEFQRRISKEWASLPKDESGKSYYAGDGLNKASATPSEVRSTLRTVANVEPRSGPRPGSSLDATPPLSGTARVAFTGDNVATGPTVIPTTAPALGPRLQQSLAALTPDPSFS